MDKIEEHAVQLERDLIIKQQETLNVLKELEEAKNFVEGFKVNIMPELSSFIASPDSNFGSRATLCNENSTDEGLSFSPVLSPGSMFVELNQAKLNLSKTSVDLAVIQASLESLNKKLRQDKVLSERRTRIKIRNSEGALSLDEHHHRTPDLDQKMEAGELKQGNFEAEQFKKMTEASRYEVMKAMTDIERTKDSIKMAEMRLNAAKKMEEAAKAVEAIAVAERKALLVGENSSEYSFSHKHERIITLSLQEYQSLTQKAKQAEDLCKTKFVDTNGLRSGDEAHHHHLEMPILEKFEETTKELMNKQSSKFKFKNSRTGHRSPDILNGDESCDAMNEKVGPGFRSTPPTGEVFSTRKLILQDDVMIERHTENGSDQRRHVSLSQMLREQSRMILHPSKPAAEKNVEKRYFIQRKKFGFIQVPIPTKQFKKKAQPTETQSRE